MTDVYGFRRCKREGKHQFRDLRRGDHRWLCTSCDDVFVWAKGARWDGSLLCEDEGHCHGMECPRCVGYMHIEEPTFVRVERVGSA